VCSKRGGVERRTYAEVVLVVVDVVLTVGVTTTAMSSSPSSEPEGITTKATSSSSPEPDADPEPEQLFPSGVGSVMGLVVGMAEHTPPHSLRRRSTAAEYASIENSAGTIVYDVVCESICESTSCGNKEAHLKQQPTMNSPSDTRTKKRNQPIVKKSISIVIVISIDTGSCDVWSCSREPYACCIATVFRKCRPM
jgi:hypothetical protein